VKRGGLRLAAQIEDDRSCYGAEKCKPDELLPVCAPGSAFAGAAIGLKNVSVLKWRAEMGTASNNAIAYDIGEARA